MKDHDYRLIQKSKHQILDINPCICLSKNQILDINTCICLSKNMKEVLGGIFLAANHQENISFPQLPKRTAKKMLNFFGGLAK